VKPITLALATEKQIMNKTNILKLVACIAWAGMAISSAAPASALVQTSQTGAYATCSDNVTTIATIENCNGIFTKKQTIRFVNTACSSGGSCNPGDYNPLVEWNYTLAGRKEAPQYPSCRPDNLFGLFTCAC
jgi:hypothetical protein